MTDRQAYMVGGLALVATGVILYTIRVRRYGKKEKTLPMPSNLPPASQQPSPLYQSSVLAKKAPSLQDLIDVISPAKDLFQNMKFKTSPLVVEEIEKRGYESSRITADRKKFWDESILKYGKSETKNIAKKMTLTPADKMYLSSKGIFV